MRHPLHFLAPLAGLLPALSCTTSVGVGSDGQGGSSTATSTTTTSGSSGATLGVEAGSVSLLAGAQWGQDGHDGYDTEISFRSAADGSNGIFTTTQVGACTIRVYTTPRIIGTQVLRSAGIITITGGTVPLHVTPSAGGSYPELWNPEGDLWSGGEILTFSATGGAVPAFTVTLPAPSIDLLSPALPPSSNVPFAVDRSASLDFAWSSGGFGDLDVFFADSTNTTEVDCTFPAGAGTGAVPAAALAALPPKSAGTFAIGGQAQDILQTGGWTIYVSASRAVHVNGVSAFMSGTYQASN